MLETKTRLPQNKEPKLAAPGAGIPWYQKIMLRLVISPFVAAKTDWPISAERFNKVSAKILKEIEGLTEAQLSTRILVPPQTGLEDSSRYWSVAMVLEHILIVGNAVAVATYELADGRVPDYKVDTAAVKPIGSMSTQEAVEKFKKFCLVDYPRLLPSLKNKNSNLKLYHPWFGMFKAQQWFWLLTTHHALHLKQIREIKKGLPLL
ncbi:DinB family protein [bacterium]|nr:DinB family protein [bacterium]